MRFQNKRNKGIELATVHHLRDSLPRKNLRYGKDLEKLVSYYQNTLHPVAIKNISLVTTEKLVSKKMSATYHYGTSQPASENNLNLIRRFGWLLSYIFGAHDSRSAETRLEAQF